MCEQAHSLTALLTFLRQENNQKCKSDFWRHIIKNEAVWWLQTGMLYLILAAVAFLLETVNIFFSILFLNIFSIIINVAFG